MRPAQDLSKLCAALALAGLVAGCASAGLDPASGERSLGRALAERGLEPVEVVVPYALDEDLRAWAHRVAPARLPAEARLEHLIEALLSEEGLELEYAWDHTGTAVEVFRDRRANCLAFTNLFLGLAREVGVPVYFLAVETETYRREGDFVVVSDHVAVGHGEGAKILMIDFSERDTAELPRVRRIGDLTAIAMFYSNRGAEELRAGRPAQAVDWLRRAVAVDPGLANGWLNLGVALRRAGDLEEAETAYRRALEIDPRLYPAYRNLATALRLQDREQEARELEATLARTPGKNPYTYLSLGDLSFRSGRYDEARRLYRRAANLEPHDPESYAALGQLAVVTGDLETARRMLRKARKRDAENERAVRLAKMLETGTSG